MSSNFNEERYQYLQSLTKEHAYKAFEDGDILPGEYLSLQKGATDFKTRTRALAALRPKEGTSPADHFIRALKKEDKITLPKHMQDEAKGRDLQDSALDILAFINSIRGSDKYIEIIYLNGGCFQFYLLLQSMFGGCEPLINRAENHVVAKHKGKLYDITGEVTEGEYSHMTVEQIKMCERWSFGKNRRLQVGVCEHCLEPITI